MRERQRELCRQERSSNLEVMRIVCILLIIAYHYVDHGAGNNWAMLQPPFSLNQIFAVVFGSWGQLGVFGFIILSCYFLNKKTSFSFYKLLLLILQTFFYSAVYAFIGFFVVGSFTWEEVALELATPFYNQYWFVTAYLLFYLIAPFLKKAVVHFSQKELGCLCIVLTVFVPCYSFLWENIGGDLAVFCYVFFLMAYLERKQNNFFERNAGKGFLLSLIIITGTLLLICFLGSALKDSRITNQIYRIIASKNLFMLTAALFMFYFFKAGKMFCCKWVNRIAGTSLGVYGVHENTLVRSGERPLLWDGILKTYLWVNSSLFVLHMAVSVLAVFFVSVCVELMRAKIMDQCVMNKMEKLRKKLARLDQWYLG